MTINQGWINLYKPKNITSFKAIDKIKKKFLIKKIGHAGTLDPLAEGILPIAIGNSTKLIPYITKNLKIYKFTIVWGTQTSTDDSEGEEENKSNIQPKLKDIDLKLKKFQGYINQTPPKISAVKINGKRAYKLARQNKIFKILPKKVYVKNIKVTEHQLSKTSFIIECGKGFYVRSFAREFAKELGTFGYISYLQRSKVGKFNLETSILLEDLLKIGHRLQEFNCIKSSISMLDDILAYEMVNNENLKDLSFGRSIKIDLSKINYSSKSKLDKELIFLSYKGDIVSIGKLIGDLFKPTRILI